MLGVGLSLPAVAMRRASGAVDPNAPTLDLNFLTGAFPSLVTFTRAGTASYTDRDGIAQTAAVNQPCLEAAGFLVRNAAGTGSAADTALITDLSWFNATEGTFVVEFSVPSISATSMYVWQMRGSTDSWRHFVRCAATSGQAQFYTVNDTTVQAQINGSNITAGAVVKAAYTYKVNDFAACLNGGTVLTDTAGTVPTAGNMLRLALGSTYNGTVSSEHLNGHLRALKYWPVRKTNTDLQGLTA
jgi:hypothetical protein